MVWQSYCKNKKGAIFLPHSVEWLGYHTLKKVWWLGYVKPFRYDTGTWQTDRQTDGQNRYINIARQHCYANHDVCTYQKLFNFVDAFNFYKQKWMMADSPRLIWPTHSVHWRVGSGPLPKRCIGRSVVADFRLRYIFGVWLCTWNDAFDAASQAMNVSLGASNAMDRRHQMLARSDHIVAIKRTNDSTFASGAQLSLTRVTKTGLQRQQLLSTEFSQSDEW